MTRPLETPAPTLNQAAAGHAKAGAMMMAPAAPQGNAWLEKISWRARPILYQMHAAIRRWSRPTLAPADLVLGTELAHVGGTVSHLDALQLPIDRAFRAEVEAILPTLPDRNTHKGEGDPLVGRNTQLHCFSVDAPVLARKFPSLLRFGLEERLLDIVEWHLGVPAALTAVHLRKDIGGGNQVGTRFWHLDTEDVRVVRMIVYLDDVGPNDGPFEYIPWPVTAAVTALRKRALRSAGDPIFDKEMREHIPESAWRAITGPKGTVLLADNAVCYHHGKVHDSQRIVLIYTYTTRNPHYPRLTRNPALDAVLSPRQRACMFVHTEETAAG